MSNRCGVVTGAAGNLGRVFSETLADLGADLILVDIDGKVLNILSRKLKETYNISVTSIECDLEQEKERNTWRGRGRGRPGAVLSAPEVKLEGVA